MTNQLLGQVLDLLQISQVQHCPENHLQVFKSLIILLCLVSGEDSLGHFSLSDLAHVNQIKKVISDTITLASKPFFFSDSIALEYFQCLTTFVGQNTEVFLSQLGVDYLLKFVLQH